SHASAVGVVDALAARGLLYREAGSEDRRITLLRLTPKGETACEQLERWGHQLSEALSGLGEKERDALELGLGAVITALRAAGHLDVAEPCRGCVHFLENAAPHSAEPHH